MRHEKCISLRKNTGKCTDQFFLWLDKTLGGNAETVFTFPSEFCLDIAICRGVVDNFGEEMFETFLLRHDPVQKIP